MGQLWSHLLFSSPTPCGTSRTWLVPLSLSLLLCAVGRESLHCGPLVQDTKLRSVLYGPRAFPLLPSTSFLPLPIHSLEGIQNPEILSVCIWAVFCLLNVRGVCVCVCCVVWLILNTCRLHSRFSLVAILFGVSVTGRVTDSHQYLPVHSVQEGHE